MLPDFSLFDKFPIPARYVDHESYYFFNDNDEEVFDVYDMYRFYDNYFFHDKLVASQVKWSSRMTLCAGTCKMDFPGSCTITLSKPLLQFRTNNELKETLIHEMIHAYLFITNPKACHDNGGHGVEFQSIMGNINQMTGLNITVYHSFHDEVDYFRKHIWRCDGQCQKQSPFYGFVKRAMNRAPGPKDPWWDQHQFKCGGTYTKIDGPEFHEDQTQKKTAKKGNSKDDLSQTEDKKKIRRKRTDENQNKISDFFKKIKMTPTTDNDEPRVVRFYLINSKENQYQQTNSKTPEQQIQKSKILTHENSCPEFIELSDSSNSISNKNDQNPKEMIQFPKEFAKKITGGIEDKKKISDVNDYFRDIMVPKIPTSNINQVSEISKILSTPSLNIESTPEKVGFITADKLIASSLTSNNTTPGKSQSESVFAFVISRENNPYMMNFWVRLLISSRRTLTELLDISMMVMPMGFPDERAVINQGQIVENTEIELYQMNFKQGSIFQDEINDITFKLEKIFYSDKLSNVKVLQAKDIPLCIGAAFFNDNGEIVEGNKEKIETLNLEISKKF